MTSKINRSPNIELLDSFYRIFVIMGSAFLFIGVPFIFYRKTGAAIVCAIILVLTLAAWRMSRQGHPARSLKLFASAVWLVMIGLLFLGLPPLTVAIALAVSIMLCIVVGSRAGILFVAAYMFAWLAYIVLDRWGLMPEPYFLSRPIVSWFVAAFAVWLVLLPVPGLVRKMRRAISLQRATIEASADGIVVMANDGTVETYNRRFAQMWQIADDAAGTGPAQWLFATMSAQLARPAQFMEKLQQKSVLNGPPELPSVDVLHLKDGRIYECNALPQRLQEEVVGRVWSFRDITDRKRDEEALRIAATAFESQEAIMITDARDVILRINRAFTDSTGYRAQDVIGQTPQLLRSGHHEAGFYTLMWEEIAVTGSWRGEVWNRRKNGEIYPNWMTITAVKGSDGAVTHYVTTQNDITLRKTAEDEIKHLAFYDPLTQLPNRRLLMDSLRRAIAASARSGRGGALMFIDLDNFKILNDTLGHDNGDALLRQVAERLPACVRDGDMVARLGGDEFVILLEELSNFPEEAAIQAEAVGEKVLQALNQPYKLVGHRYHCTPSIGIALLTEDKNAIEEIMKRADLAMYQAKAAGRNCLRFFDPAMQAVVTAHANLEEELRQALERQEFRLFYQAQVDNNGCLLGAEALVRWAHPSKGLVPPDEFIPLSEQTGIIVPLGLWVLEAACKQLLVWAARPETAHLTLAVNVSARQFRQPAFVGLVMAVLAQTGADPLRLKLELTESLLLDDVDDVIAKMTALKAQGVGLSLDDFGTGYSSLSYLKRLPLDQLKIDRSFVKDVLTNKSDAAIARTIVALGENLGLRVVAEGIETEAQWEFLKDLGCRAYQGYFFGRPMPLDAFGQSPIFRGEHALDA